MPAPSILLVVLAAGPGLEPVTPKPRPESLRTLDAGTLEGSPVPRAARQVFDEPYAIADGVFTFRGNPRRSGGAFGTIPDRPARLRIAWTHATGRSPAPWFGGAGWTGQPAIVRWPSVVRHSMTRLGPRRLEEGLTEVIQGSLDGRVYFLDLKTGKPTRRPLETGNPIKGSVSVDPRAYPLLFVGQGIPSGVPIGLRVYDLITHRQVYFLPGRDPDAPRRGWGAFDGSGLLNRATDTYVVGGENGLVYLLHLGTRFDPIALTLGVNPRLTRYRYRHHNTATPGVENSLSVFRNLAFFADNSGLLQAVDLRTFEPVWTFDAGDDTDASLAIDADGDELALYTGTEVDRTGPRGRTYLRRLDGLRGEVRWALSRPCLGARSPKKVDAGVFATPAVGQGDVADLVFFTLARCPGPDGGSLLAIDKRTGIIRWERKMPRFSWSSPTLVTTRRGTSYLLQGALGGRVELIDAREGEVAASVQLVGDIEASPAVFDQHVVVGTRADRIYGLIIEAGNTAGELSARP